MKTKNKVTFEENRLLKKAPKAGAEVASETPESPTDKAVKLIAKINELRAIEGGDNPASILENNPYKDALLTFAEDLDAKSYEFTSVDYKPGKLVLKYSDHEVVIEKELFVAIFWKEISKKLDEAFKGKNVSPELMALAVEQHSQKFDALVFAVAAGSSSEKIDKRVKYEALAELEGLRPALNPEAAGARARAKGSVERAQLRESLPKKAPLKLPTEPVLSKEEFLSNDQYKIDQNALDRLAVNVTREDTHIDANQWNNHFKLDGLQKIYDDCQQLEVFSQNPNFYKTMFAILRNGITTNPYLKDDNYRKMFENPANHIQDLQALAPKDGFLGGDLYVKAYEHLQDLRKLLLQQDAFQKGTLGKQRDLDSDPIATKATDFVKDNLSKFQKAIRERDYATAGLYAVGIFAMYKTFQKLSGGGGHGSGHGEGNISKWLLYGAAAYAGNIFLKNAGYDVLKMAGFRDPDYEVKGTPMEVMRNILSRHPQLSETSKDIDYGIVLRVSDVKLASLQDLLEKSNDHGIQFIEPHEFPDIFPELANVSPFNMGLGERGLQDNTGMSNVKLTPSQREYMRVGQQLYKIALGLEGIYDETLRKDHPAYKGKTYKEAIQGHGTRKLAKVRHLLDAVSPYSVRTPDKLSRIKRIDVQSKLEELFKSQRSAGLVIEEPVNPGHYPGKLMGFPIIVVVDEANKVYRLYLKNNYGGKEMPGNVFTEIPFEGPSSARSIEKAVESVKGRVMELLRNLDQAAGKSLASTLYYDDGWKCKVKLPGAAEYDIASTEETATIELLPDGKSVNLNAANGAQIHIDEEVAKQYPVALAVIPKVVDQKEFNALKVLNATGKIKFQDATPGDGQFVLLLGKKELKVEIKYDKAAKKFEFADPAQEAQLLKKGSGFGEEIKEALRDDARLTAVMESWRQLIDNTPESYFINFFQNVPDWFTRATLTHPLRGVDLKDFTGSVPKNYTKGLIETQREVILSKLAANIDGAGSLEDVSDQIGKIFTPAVMDFERQRDKFSSLNTKNYKEGENFSEEEFNDTVLRGITEVGIQSNDYKSWYKQFVDEMFMRHGMDDLHKGNAIKSRDLINVFVHYTAVLDDPSIDGAKSNITITQEMSDRVQKVNAAIIKLGSSATDAAIESETGIPAYEVPAVKKVAEELEKAAKYNLFSQYAEYVAGQIYIKINEGSLNNRTSVPNAVSGFWDIETFDVWKNHPRVSSQEFIDRRDVLRASDDYVPFDVYLGLPDTQRDAYPESMITLPRQSCQLAFKRKKDFDLFAKLSGTSNTRADGKFDNMQPMGLEKAFHDRFMEALSKLKEKFEIKADPFDDLMKAYSPSFAVSQDPASAAGNIIFNYTVEGGNSLAAEIQNLENELNQLSQKTITRGDQEHSINVRIARLIEDTIVNNNNFDKYFQRNTLPKWFKEKWTDFKNWLFG